VLHRKGDVVGVVVVGVDAVMIVVAVLMVIVVIAAAIVAAIVIAVVVIVIVAIVVAFRNDAIASISAMSMLCPYPSKCCTRERRPSS
jgi:hypothetical protein